MNPHKNNISKNSPFKVPENYFGNFEEKMMRKLEESNPEIISEKRAGFKVPQGYFENLEENILAKTKQNEPKVINLVKREYLFYAAAVAALLIMLVGDVFKTGTEQTPGWDDLEISAMENYIDEGYDMGVLEYNTLYYSEFLDTGDQLVGEEDFNDINSEAALEYIDENIDDPSYILD